MVIHGICGIAVYVCRKTDTKLDIVYQKPSEHEVIETNKFGAFSRAGV
jgi:hypothetical protein